MNNTVTIGVLLTCLLLSGCMVNYQVTKDKQINKNSTVYNNAPKVTEDLLELVDKKENKFCLTRETNLSSNITGFDPENQYLSLSVWNKANGNLVFLELGDYVTRDSFEIEGFVTNRNKNARVYISKKFSSQSFNSVYLDTLNTKKGRYRIIFRLDSLGKEEAAGSEVVVEGLYSYTTANGNLKTYRGEYSDNGNQSEFIAQTDPVPVLIILAGVAMASAAATYFFVSNSSTECNGVVNYEECRDCIKGGGRAKFELTTSKLFGQDGYGEEKIYISCK
ncbi:MAG: hypothetical protein H6559_36715 [Lewinellaceae bacterium]|nr:hypothetical protein [Lewinellaceae bacterium]